MMVIIIIIIIISLVIYRSYPELMALYNVKRVKKIIIYISQAWNKKYEKSIYNPYITGLKIILQKQ